MGAKKTYILSDESLDIMHRIMEEHSLKSETAVLEYVLVNYDMQKNIEERLDQIVQKHLKTFLNSMQSSMRQTEGNTFLLLDAINTILMERGYQECYPAGTMPSRVIQESERLQKKRIIKMKQMKDHRLSRRK